MDDLNIVKVDDFFVSPGMLFYAQIVAGKNE